MYLFNSSRSKSLLEADRPKKPKKYQVLGTKYLVPSTWCQILGTKYLVPNTPIGPKAQGPGPKAQGPGPNRAQGPGPNRAHKAQGSHGVHIYGSKMLQNVQT